MIWESSIWKEEIQKELDDFYCYLKSEPDIENEYFSLRVEKIFFVSAFIIRKLIESNKISDELLAKQYSAHKYKRITKESLIDFLNCHHVDEFYDLQCPELCTFRIKEICNLLIHSFVFILSLDENLKLIGVFINSDRLKNSWLYELNIEIFFKIISDVTNDDIVSMEYNRETGMLKKSNKDTM